MDRIVHAAMRLAKCAFRIAPIATLLCIAVARAATSPCEPGITSVGGELGYHLRGTESQGDLRCEGLYRAPHAGALELLSFVHLQSMATAAGRVELRVPALLQLPNSTVTVRVQALHEKVFYRLDARAQPGTTIRWPSAEVIERIGLAPDDLGVVATLVGQDPPVLVPMIAPTTSATSDKNRTVLIVRAPLRLERVQWRLYAAGSKTLTVPWTRLPVESFPAGWPITIPLPLGLAGTFVIDIYATPENRDVPERLSARLLL